GGGGGGARADGDSLVHERGDGDPPPVAHAAEATGVGHGHVGEVHLVELGVAAELAQRPYFHAGTVHVEHEGGETLVLGLVGVGPGQQEAPAGHVGYRRPNLLPV